MTYEELEQELDRVICKHTEVSLSDLAALLHEKAQTYQEEADRNAEEETAEDTED